jgi:hypothetical protein
MSLSLLTKLALIGCIAISAGLSGCETKTPRPANAVAQPSPSQTPEPEYVSNPTCCGLLEGPGKQGIDVAWRSFTSDGRYRLARKEDFKSTARAFGSDDPLNSIFAYCWGRLGYEPNTDRWYHLAAIVVDTHRADDAHFGLVIFSAPKNGAGIYQPYWLYRDRDLSRTVVWTGTGDLMVADYRDDGSRDVSYVQWDARRKQFVATTSYPKPT